MNQQILNVGTFMVCIQLDGRLEEEEEEEGNEGNRSFLETVFISSQSKTAWSMMHPVVIFNLHKMAYQLAGPSVHPCRENLFLFRPTYS